LERIGPAGHYGPVPHHFPQLAATNVKWVFRAAGPRHTLGAAALAESVGLRVQYLTDPANPKSECWTFLSLRRDLDGAVALARDGFPDVRAHLGARCFRILDDTGQVLAEEQTAQAPLQFDR
jgi:hypothetical protein